MRKLELSAAAEKLLRYFKDNRFLERAYELPKPLSDLFEDDPEGGVEAQLELVGHGLIEVGDPNPSHFPTRIRAAAPTLAGLQYAHEHL